MQHVEPKAKWESYKSDELAKASPLLTEMGFVLDDEQPHLSGERFLMQAVTTAAGRKLILLGTRVSDGTRVVIKATSDIKGTEEIEHERTCRKILGELGFAYGVFYSPEEIAYGARNGMTISIQRFLEQEKPFLERPLEEQFGLALTSLKAQEGAHATTYAHYRLAEKTFGARDENDYLTNYEGFKDKITAALGGSSEESVLIARGEKLLKEHDITIARYSGFLTHTDFVPHNLRIQNGRIYLLDHSSLQFGNKYEGWARFTNFMTLYNPPLEEALIEYVRLNRAKEESLSFKLMRVYRLGEIISFYVRASGEASGDLKRLELKRIEFWGEVLSAVLEDKRLPDTIRENYKKDRDAVRSDEEKKRQIGLH